MRYGSIKNPIQFTLYLVYITYRYNDNFHAIVTYTTTIFFATLEVPEYNNYLLQLLLQ